MKRKATRTEKQPKQRKVYKARTNTRKARRTVEVEPVYMDNLDVRI